MWRCWTWCRCAKVRWKVWQKTSTILLLPPCCGLLCWVCRARRCAALLIRQTPCGAIAAITAGSAGNGRANGQRVPMMCWRGCPHALQRWRCCWLGWLHRGAKRGQHATLQRAAAVLPAQVKRLMLKPSRNQKKKQQNKQKRTPTSKPARKAAAFASVWRNCRVRRVALLRPIVAGLWRRWRWCLMCACASPTPTPCTPKGKPRKRAT